MAKRGKLNWKGDQVKRTVQEASIRGLDETTSKCVVIAKVRVRKKTTTLQGSIRIEPARVWSNGARAEWGSFDVNYALWQEIGTAVMSAQPYLRPAADSEYPQLKDRIQANLRGRIS